jgi:D-glycero-D-manno-heptose 1,7-bisphosphate phosphatase
MSRPAVFIDKDGTLIADVAYNVDPHRIALSEGAGPALRSLQALGFELIVVTNQPGVGEGRFPASALAPVRGHIESLLAEHGVRLRDFCFCPHAADARPACRCRKPAPGLLTQAAREHGLDLAESWMVGDILNDVEAGRRAGCRTVLVDCGNETEWLLSQSRMPHFVASDLRGAATVIAAARECSRQAAEAVQ